MSLASASILLFLILDPLGNLPVFNHFLAGVPPDRRPRVILRECGFALLVLLGFLWFGGSLMDLLALRRESLAVGGGIVLFLIALKMVFPEHGVGSGTDREAGEEPFLVPLGVPLVAGPSALAFLLLLASKEPRRLGDWSAALGLAWAASTAILMASGRIEAWLGVRLLRAIEKLAGMLLILLAVQMFLDGLRPTPH